LHTVAYGSLSQATMTRTPYMYIENFEKQDVAIASRTAHSRPSDRLQLNYW